MWEECVILEYERRRPPIRGRVIYTNPVKPNLAAIRHLETGDEVQQRRFPASARTENRYNFATTNAQIAVNDSLHGPECLVNVVQLKMRLSLPPILMVY